MDVSKLAHAVSMFREGAQLHATGALLTNNDTITLGLRKIKSALAVIDDESHDGRDILIPFLRDDHPMVRCEAARALHATQRELATPVLQDLDLTCATEAADVAHFFLVFAGEPNVSSDLLSQQYPHRHSDELFEEALTRLEQS